MIFTKKPADLPVPGPPALFWGAFGLALRRYLFFSKISRNGRFLPEKVVSFILVSLVNIILFT